MGPWQFDREGEGDHPWDQGDRLSGRERAADLFLSFFQILQFVILLTGVDMAQGNYHVVFEDSLHKNSLVVFEDILRTPTAGGASWGTHLGNHIAI